MLPLFLNATRRKYPPNERGKHKEREVACRFHTTPHLLTLLGGNTPHDREVNKRKWRWCIGFTLPPFVDSAGRKYCRNMTKSS